MRQTLINFDFWLNSMTNWQFMIFMVLFFCALFTVAMITYWIARAASRLIRKPKKKLPFIDNDLDISKSFSKL